MLKRTPLETQLSREKQLVFLPRPFLLGVGLGIAVALIFAFTAKADAAPIIIGHRGTNTTTIPENTLKAMQYATPHAQMLEADIQWTKDSNDADTVGTIIVFHDSTLDRTTNCTGYVYDRLWTYIRDVCHTEIGNQSILKLVDLITYAKTVNKPILFHMKTVMNTAQAKQFWNITKHAPIGSLLAGSKSRVPGILIVKKLDSLNPDYKLRYGYETSGEPSVSYVKTIGPYLVIEKDITKARVAYYRNSGLKVYLWTGKNETDYASMLGKNPDGVIVDDAKRYQEWLVSR